MRCCEKSVDNTQTALSEVNGKVNKMLLKCIVVKCSREQEIDNITLAAAAERRDNSITSEVYLETFICLLSSYPASKLKVESTNQNFPTNT